MDLSNNPWGRGVRRQKSQFLHDCASFVPSSRNSNSITFRAFPTPGAAAYLDKRPKSCVWAISRLNPKKGGNFEAQEYIQRGNYFALQFHNISEKSKPRQITGITVLYQFFKKNHTATRLICNHFRSDCPLCTAGTDSSLRAAYLRGTVPSGCRGHRDRLTRKNGSCKFHWELGLSSFTWRAAHDPSSWLGRKDGHRLGGKDGHECWRFPRPVPLLLLWFPQLRCGRAWMGRSLTLLTWLVCEAVSLVLDRDWLHLPSPLSRQKKKIHHGSSAFFYRRRRTGTCSTSTVIVAETGSFSLLVHFPPGFYCWQSQSFLLLSVPLLLLFRQCPWYGAFRFWP